MSECDLLCGDCLVEVVTKTAADGSGRVRCPSCGHEDTVDNALKDAADHGLYEAIGGTFDGWKTTGAIRVRQTDAPARRFRFIFPDRA